MVGYVYWVIIASFFILVELGHPGLFFFLSFGFGALLSAGLDVFEYSLFYQILGFFVGSFCSLIILKMSTSRLIGRRAKHATNVEALIGKKGITIKEIIPPISGQVRLNGQVWSAKSIHEQTIQKNSNVEVVRVVGCHLLVKEVSSHQAT